MTNWRSNKRILWIDSLKLLAIITVVWGHVIHRMGWYEGNLSYTGTHGFIYSFHMPLFMTLSGFVSYKMVNGELDVIKKFRQLLVPCIILYIICAIVGFEENFWYLKSLFLCYVIWGFYFKSGIRLKGPLFIFACFLFFPLLCHIPVLGYCKIDFMLPFFGFGLLLHRYNDYIERNMKLLLCIVALSFLICELLWNQQFIYYNSPSTWIDYKSLIINQELVFHFDNLLHVSMRYLTGLFGSLFFILLARVIYRSNNNIILLNIAKWGGIPCIFTFYKPL